ncbi:MAG: hypothetical protein HQ582_10525 [Planctomycetes bacterium]|nr:hypothetical protein [Planctomycetota bacterium]
MKASRELQKAHFEFREWIRRLRGNSARHVQTGEADPIARQHVTVQPTEAIDVFLHHRPEHNAHRDGLQQLVKEPLHLIEELWNKAQP